MPQLILTYFDIDASRGEVARLALNIGGIAFEDRRIPRKDWAAVRDQYPFQALPVLEVDGRVIAQSNTINRYVGKLAGLYPRDDLQAALVDEVMAAIEDVTGKIGARSRASPSEIRYMTVCVDRRSCDFAPSVYIRSFVTST